MLPAPVKRSIAELQMIKRNLESQVADLTVFDNYYYIINRIELSR